MSLRFRGQMLWQNVLPQLLLRKYLFEVSLSNSLRDHVAKRVAKGLPLLSFVWTFMRSFVEISLDVFVTFFQDAANVVVARPFCHPLGLSGKMVRLMLSSKSKRNTVSSKP